MIRFLLLGVLLAVAVSGVQAQGKKDKLGGTTQPTQTQTSGNNDAATTTDFGSQRDTSQQDGLLADPVDTFPVLYYFADDPAVIFTFRDTLLGQMQWYEPVQLPWQWGFHLGAAGTAYRPLWLPWEARGGFHAGWRQFDVYKIAPRQVRYFLPRLPHAALSYTQGTEQNDAQVGVTVSRSFAHNVGFTLDYRRTSNLNRRDIQIHGNTYYDSPGAADIALTMGVSWRPEAKPYELYVAFTSNTNLQNDIGGITTDTVFQSEGAFSSSYVYLEDANTRQQDRALSVHQYYALLGGKKAVAPAPVPPRQPRLPADSLGTSRDSVVVPPPPPAAEVRGSGSSLQLHHALQYQVYKYKFSDVKADTFYGLLLTDERGLRHYADYLNIENLVALRLNRERPDGQVQYIEAGLQHNYFGLNQEPLDTGYQNLQLRGKMRLPIGNSTLLSANAMLGLAFQQAGDYHVQANIQQTIGGKLRLTGMFLNQLYSPTMMQQRSYISQRQVWNNDFGRTFENNLGGALGLLARDSTEWLQARVTYRIVNNYIYFDSTYTPQQTDQVVNILQAGGYARLRVGMVHLDQSVVFTAASDVIRLPAVWTQSSLYVEHGLFKKALLLKYGADLRWHTAYRPDGYMPALGQFYIQDTYTQQPYPLADVYIAGKVKTFRFFAKLENVAGFFTDKLWYPTYGHPLPDRYFRFGVSLILSN